MARRSKKKSNSTAAIVVVAVVAVVLALAALVYRAPSKIADLLAKGRGARGAGATGEEDVPPAEIAESGSLTNAGILGGIIGVPSGELVAVAGGGSPDSPNFIERVAEFFAEGEDGKHVGDHLLTGAGMILGSR